MSAEAQDLVAYLDIETKEVNWSQIRMAEPTVICIQVVGAVSTTDVVAHHTYLRQKGTSDEFDLLQDTAIISEIRDIFLNPSVKFIVAYNGYRFDFPILERFCQFSSQEYNEIVRPKLYDPFAENKLQGLRGAGLDNVALLNALPGKSGSGAKAPMLWDTDQFEELSGYCMNDVEILKRLCLQGEVRVPKRGRGSGSNQCYTTVNFKPSIGRR